MIEAQIRGACSSLQTLALGFSQNPVALIALERRNSASDIKVFSFTLSVRRSQAER